MGRRESKPESTPEIQICEGHREAILSKKNLTCIYTPLKTYINALLIPAIDTVINPHLTRNSCLFSYIINISNKPNNMFYIIFEVLDSWFSDRFWKKFDCIIFLVLFYSFIDLNIWWFMHSSTTYPDSKFVSINYRTSTWDDFCLNETITQSPFWKSFWKKYYLLKHSASGTKGIIGSAPWSKCQQIDWLSCVLRYIGYWLLA